MFAASGTFNPIGSAVFMALTQDAGDCINTQLSARRMTTHRTAETLIMQAPMFKLYDKLLIAILDMMGQTIICANIFYDW